MIDDLKSLQALFPDIQEPETSKTMDANRALEFVLLMQKMEQEEDEELDEKVLMVLDDGTKLY